MRRNPLPWILAFAALVLAAGIGLRDPQPPDEPRFVLAAKQMVETGDWLFPRRGSELYSHKPPPFMWAIAASHAVVGSWRVAFLLPSLLAALGTLWLVHDLAARLWGRRIAPYAALALLATLQFGLQAKRAQIDAVLVFLTTLALYALLRHLLLKPDARAKALGWFAAGFGTITKGVGFLPLLAYLPAAWARRRGWYGLAHQTEPSWAKRLAPLAFLAAVGLWLLPMLASVLLSGDPAQETYAREILLKQTGERYANPWHHIKPAWYYLGVIATLWLPLALALPGLLPAWWRRLRRGDGRYLVLLGWVALVLLFFSASPGKREVYILPALPALCLAAAPLLPGLLRKRWLQWSLLAYVGLLSLAALALGAGGVLGEPAWERRLLLARGLEQTPPALFAWMLAIAAGGTLLIAWLRLRRAGLAAVGFTGLLWLAYGLGFMPALDPASSSRELMARVGERIGPEAELALLGWREQQYLQADRAVTDFGFERPWEAQWPDAAAWLSQAPQRRWLFVLDAALSRCVDAGQAIAIGRANRRDWLLLPGSALSSGCAPGEGETFDRRAAIE
jgi:4-amino-4-deoxy-L-arabinose transferase-like glycosyltransferase